MVGSASTTGRRRLLKYVLALLAVALWAALRLFPGDITPEAPETFLRRRAPRPPSPRLAWAKPQPFPSYDPEVAWSLLDHLAKATVFVRETSDTDALQQEGKDLRTELSSSWLSASGRWRVAGDGVVSCFGPPAEPGVLAAALRAQPGRPAREVSVQVRWLTLPRPEERVGLTPGLDARGSGLALLVGYRHPGALVSALVEVKDYGVAEVLGQAEVPKGPFPEDGPGPWFTLELARSGEGWEARVAGRSGLQVDYPGRAGVRPGVLLLSEGTRASFFGLRLDSQAIDEEEQTRLLGNAEGQRLTQLLAEPGDPNFQFEPDAPALTKRVTIAGVRRPAIVAPAPSQVFFGVPRDRPASEFRVWVGLHPAAWTAGGTFASPRPLAEPVLVEIAPGSDLETPALWTRTLDPDRPEDHRWLEVRLPLAQAKGSPVLALRARTARPGAASLSTVPGGYVVWGSPHVRLVPPVWQNKPRATPKRPASLVVIVIDSLRADALRCTHPAGVAAPSIDRLAAKGVVFENAFSQAPAGIPSLATIHSGLWPEVHGTDPADPRTPGLLPPAAVTLAESLRRFGYRTAWMSERLPLPGLNLEQGFDEVVTVAVNRGEGAASLFRQGASWLLGRSEEPVFLHLHSRWLARTVDEVLHEPPQDLDRLRDRLRRRYREELLSVDRALGEFTGALAEAGLLEQCVVVVTGDHGTDLCDRYPTIIPGGPGFTLRDEQLHVPLVIRAAEGQAVTRRIAGQVRLIDLAPTVCELLGVPPAEHWQGVSLAQAVTAGAPVPDLPVFASATSHKPDRVALRHRDHKYIKVLRPGEPRGHVFLEPLADQQLYNTLSDPDETCNLAREAPGVVAEMESVLREQAEKNEVLRKQLFPCTAPTPPGEEESAPQQESSEQKRKPRDPGEADLDQAPAH